MPAVHISGMNSSSSSTYGMSLWFDFLMDVFSPIYSPVDGRLFFSSPALIRNVFLVLVTWSACLWEVPVCAGSLVASPALHELLCLLCLQDGEPSWSHWGSILLHFGLLLSAVLWTSFSFLECEDLLSFSWTWLYILKRFPFFVYGFAGGEALLHHLSPYCCTLI